MALFGVEVQAKARPLAVIRALVYRHLSLIKPPLKGYPRFFGNLLHQHLFG
jgi:hypothetical protein